LTLLAAFGETACDRSRLTASHGRAYREAFARQIANPNAGNKPQSDKAVQGLDSQEAAIVSKTYRKNLAPRDDDATRGQMLYYSPRTGQPERRDLPPPSVPGEQR
jgi:hypothetical protein